MLCAGVVHGDLSDFNVLVGADGPVLIDFPQSVDTAHNANARKLLLRDVDNLHRFLGQFAPHARRLPYAEEMWELFQQNAITPETRLTGRYRPSERRANTTPCSSSFRTRTTTSASGANRSVYADALPHPRRSPLGRDPRPIERREVGASRVGIPGLPPPRGPTPTPSREGRSTGRRRPRGMPTTGPGPRPPRAMATTGPGIRTPRVARALTPRAPVGRGPASRGASATKGGASR